MKNLLCSAACYSFVLGLGLLGAAPFSATAEDVKVPAPNSPEKSETFKFIFGTGAAPDTGTQL